MREKPKIGQIVYSLNVGNAASKYRPQELTPMVVVKAGIKYFSCEAPSTCGTITQYHLATWKEKTAYSPTSMLYLTRMEWSNEKETTEICNKLNEAFEYGHNRRNLSLDILRRINALLAEDNKNL